MSTSPSVTMIVRPVVLGLLLLSSHSHCFALAPRQRGGLSTSSSTSSSLWSPSKSASRTSATTSLGSASSSASAADADGAKDGGDAAVPRGGGGSGGGATSSGGTATIPNEVFNLIKSIVGAGVLSLPAGTVFFWRCEKAGSI